MHFRFLNIPVYIHPTFWVFLLLFTDLYHDFCIVNLMWGVILIFSLLIHEYGHALTAAYFGARPSITLEAFGGKAEYPNVGITLFQRFLITLNGPLFTGLLIAVPYFLLSTGVFKGSPYMHYFLYATMRLNILWLLFNIIPIAPLDGGHLMSYLLERKLGDKGQRLSLLIGIVCALLFAPCFYLQGYFFFGTLLLILGFQSFQMLRQLKTQGSENSEYTLYMKGIEAIQHQNLDEARPLLSKLLKSKDAHLKHSAIESLAHVYFQQHEFEKSYNLLLNSDHGLLKEGKCLLCKLAFDRKNFELVSRYSRDIYEIDPSFETAVLNSKAFACLNHPYLSGAWLHTASQFGISHSSKIKDVLSLNIYDSVRNHAIFQRNTEKIEEAMR